MSYSIDLPHPPPPPPPPSPRHSSVPIFFCTEPYIRNSLLCFKLKPNKPLSLPTKNHPGKTPQGGTMSSQVKQPPPPPSVRAPQGTARKGGTGSAVSTTKQPPLPPLPQSPPLRTPPPPATKQPATPPTTKSVKQPPRGVQPPIIVLTGGLAKYREMKSVRFGAVGAAKVMASSLVKDIGGREAKEGLKASDILLATNGLNLCTLGKVTTNVPYQDVVEVIDYTEESNMPPDKTLYKVATTTKMNIMLQLPRQVLPPFLETFREMCRYVAKRDCIVMTYAETRRPEEPPTSYVF